MSLRKTAEQSGSEREAQAMGRFSDLPSWASREALLQKGSLTRGALTRGALTIGSGDSSGGSRIKKVRGLSEAQEQLLYQVADGGCSALVALRARWLLWRNSEARSFLLDYYDARELTEAWCTQSFPSSDGTEEEVNWEALWGRISAGIDQGQGVTFDAAAAASPRATDLGRSGGQQGFSGWWREWRGATVVGTALASILFIVYSQDNQLPLNGGSERVAQAPTSNVAPEGRPVLARNQEVFDSRKLMAQRGAAANVVAVNASSKPRRYYSTDIYGGQPVARQLGRYVIPGREMPVGGAVASSQDGSASGSNPFNGGDLSELLEVGPKPLETVVASSMRAHRSAEIASVNDRQVASQLASNSVGRSSKLSAHELDWLRSQGAINVIRSSSGKGGVLWVSRK